MTFSEQVTYNANGISSVHLVNSEGEEYFSNNNGEYTFAWDETILLQVFSTISCKGYVFYRWPPFSRFNTVETIQDLANPGKVVYHTIRLLPSKPFTLEPGEKVIVDVFLTPELERNSLYNELGCYQFILTGKS